MQSLLINNSTRNSCTAYLKMAWKVHRRGMFIYANKIRTTTSITRERYWCVARLWLCACRKIPKSFTKSTMLDFLNWIAKNKTCSTKYQACLISYAYPQLALTQMHTSQTMTHLVNEHTFYSSLKILWHQVLLLVGYHTIKTMTFLKKRMNAKKVLHKIKFIDACIYSRMLALVCFPPIEYLRRHLRNICLSSFYNRKTNKFVKCPTTFFDGYTTNNDSM